jgi:hypothetical protein
MFFLRVVLLLFTLPLLVSFPLRVNLEVLFPLNFAALILILVLLPNT